MAKIICPALVHRISCTCKIPLQIFEE